MHEKKYKQIQAATTFFIGAIIALATVRDSYILAVSAVITGMVFMIVVRSKIKMRTDEREATIQEKAARTTYAVFTPTIAITAFFLLLPSKSGFHVFSKGEWLYIESLGMIFAYLTLFVIAIYSLSYHFFNRKYGGNINEK
ncbi:MAG: DUF2178 domain-containing protein [Patescibacteria group bacterium]